MAMEVVKGENTITQAASEYGLHPNQVRQWKDHLLSLLPVLFSGRSKKTNKERNQIEDELYRQIGQLKVEN